jgi:catechol 2,3-dioxygenase-like lactoylglutathione lyase family enzyme
MNVLSAVPTFVVSDVAKTASWYSENLGFQIVGLFPKQAPHSYASLQLGPAEIMLLALANYEKEDLAARRPEGVWDAYIRLDGVNALYESVKGERFIQSELIQRPYGNWEFEVRDLNGYVLVFGGAY